MDIKALAAVTAAALVRTSRRVIWFMSFLPGLTRVSPAKTPRVAFYSYHRFLFRDEKMKSAATVRDLTIAKPWANFFFWFWLGCFFCPSAKNYETLRKSPV
jgi:hypothetical protein